MALLALPLSLGCAAPGARTLRPPHPLAGLEPGWNRIAADGGTACALGTPYAFFVRPGHARRVTLMFQGGGACWSPETCDLASGKPIFDPAVDDSDDPSDKAGLLDLDDRRNPVRDDTVVLLPYCTGDLHLGSRDVRYSRRDSIGAMQAELAVSHRGASNVEATLRWIFARFPSLERVFVVGMSAGAVPSPFYATRFASRYPEAFVVQLGDGAGGYRSSQAPRLLSGWGALTTLWRDPGYGSADSATISFQTLYLVSARTSPRVVRAQVNTSEDAEQLYFLHAIGETATSLAPLLGANLAEIRAADPTFRSYTVRGTRHTTLTRPEFYTERVGDVALRDWVADLLAERRVPNVGDAVFEGGP